jgi:hypothetical protein
VLFRSVRKQMHIVRRGMLLTFIGLALMMNAPVWYLIGRLSELVGGTGWYRSFVIEAAIKHFSEWWLIGTSRTVHWSPWGENALYSNSDMMDITNDYIMQGLNGGVLMLGLFLAIIVRCFKTIGGLLRQSTNLPIHEKLVWGLGVAVAAHCISFISVSYFDQIKVFWFWLLAVIAAVSERDRQFPAPAVVIEPVRDLPAKPMQELVAIMRTMCPEPDQGIGLQQQGIP